MKALEKIKWLEDIFVTRKEEQHFEVNIDIKYAFIEAIKELEDIQNRSCNNCKHYKQSSSQDYKSCYEIKVNGFNLESEKYFYCNKWESK